jgi:Tfp pilus assembly protein PilV
MMVSQKVSGSPGFSLLEVVVSLGVLAVAIPLALAGIVGSTNADLASRADSLAGSIVAVCLKEWSEAKGAKEEIGGDESGGVWSMGFASTGESCGKIEVNDYRSGCRKAGVVYLARVEETPAEDASHARGILVSVEFPAMAAEAKRQRLEFFTRLP